MQTPEQVISNWNSENFHCEFDFHSQRKQWNKVYGEWCGKNMQLLKDSLEAENGMTNHPKANKLWNYVWEEYHSFTSDIPGKYRELVELID